MPLPRQSKSSKIFFKKITVLNFTKNTHKEHIIRGYVANSLTFNSMCENTYRQSWNKSWSLKHTYYAIQTLHICIAVYVPFDVNCPPSMRMLVPLGTGKSILWLGIISAQYNTTAITADKTGVKKSPSRSRPALGF